MEGIGVVFILAAVVLAIAAMLMPLYVIAIYGHVRRIRELMDEWYDKGE